MSNRAHANAYFTNHRNAQDEALTMIEQSALNLLVELGSITATDRDLFSIAIILEMTVEQVSNVMFVYKSLCDEVYNDD